MAGRAAPRGRSEEVKAASETIAFLDGDVEAYFIFNLLVNAIFATDIVFNFFLPFRDTIANGGAMVKDHRRSAIVRSVTRGDRGWGAWLGQDPVRGAPRARGGDAASSAACAATFSLSTVAYPRSGRRPSTS